MEGLPADPPQPERPGRTRPVRPRPALPPPSGRRDPGVRIQAADPRVPLQDVPLGTLVALPLGLSLPELERFWLLSTLAALEGNRTHCSQKLDIALRTVRNKINEYRAAGFEIPTSGHGRDD